MSRLQSSELVPRTASKVIADLSLHPVRRDPVDRPEDGGRSAPRWYAGIGSVPREMGPLCPAGTARWPTLTRTGSEYRTRGTRRWLAETYPAIERLAAEGDAEILWTDEVGVDADHHPGRGYAREGERATMEVPGPHIRVNQITAVSNEGTVRFLTDKGSLDAAVFLVFLTKLIEGATRKILLIADRLPAHKTPEVRAWIEAHKARIEVFYLPAYSPERNPVEYLNNDMKGEVNKAGLPDNRGTLHARVLAFMKNLARVPRHVVSSFLHPQVQYAAAIVI
jgi:transposase